MADFTLSDNLVVQGSVPLAFGENADAQMHRGDMADVIEQRRGTNSQWWRLYDRFVSHSDYDRLAVYIGGGPTLITAEIETESTVGNQPIALKLASTWQVSSGTGALIFESGLNTLTMRGDSAGIIATPTGTFNFTGLNRIDCTDVILGRLIATPADGLTIDILQPASPSVARDSHNFVMKGKAREAGGTQRVVQWNQLVNVQSITGDSRYVFQNVDQFGNGTFDLLAIEDDGSLITAISALGSNLVTPASANIRSVLQGGLLGTGATRQLGDLSALGLDGVFIVGITVDFQALGATGGITDFDVGDGSDVDRYAAAQPLGDSTLDMGDATADPTGFHVSGGTILATANGGNFDNGGYTLVVHYIDLTAGVS